MGKNLEERETLYRSLFEMAPVGLGIADLQGNLIAYNDSMLAPGGYTREDIARIKNVALLYYDPDDRARALELAGRQGYLDRYEVRFKRKDGTPYHTLLSLRPIQIKEQRYWQAMVEDITQRKHTEEALLSAHETLEKNVQERTADLQKVNTALQLEIGERKQAEKALRESEERFRQLAENIGEVFWLSNLAKDRLIYISPGYEKIWGRTIASLYASPLNWLEAIHPEDRSRVRQAALTKQAAGQYDEIYRIQRPDGAIRWIRDRAFPVRDETGAIYRIAGIAEDITELKRAEAALRESEKLAAIGQMAARIAHEINNPLAAIQSSFRLISRAVPQQHRHHHYIEKVDKEIDRIAQIVRRMLEL